MNDTNREDPKLSSTLKKSRSNETSVLLSDSIKKQISKNKKKKTKSNIKLKRIFLSHPDLNLKD